MMDPRLARIHTFDDGYQDKADMPNEWRIVGTLFRGGKLVLVNTVTGTRISSISAWKTESL